MNNTILLTALLLITISLSAVDRRPFSCRANFKRPPELEIPEKEIPKLPDTILKERLERKGPPAFQSDCPVGQRLEERRKQMRQRFERKALMNEKREPCMHLIGEWITFCNIPTKKHDHWNLQCDVYDKDTQKSLDTIINEFNEHIHTVTLLDRHDDLLSVVNYLPAPAVARVTIDKRYYTPIYTLMIAEPYGLNCIKYIQQLYEYERKEYYDISSIKSE